MKDKKKSEVKRKNQLRDWEESVKSFLSVTDDI